MGKVAEPLYPPLLIQAIRISHFRLMVKIIGRDALPVNALFRRELAAILIGGDAILKVVLVLIPTKRKHHPNNG